MLEVNVAAEGVHFARMIGSNMILNQLGELVKI
jgi:hypothetical protein